MKTQLLLLAVFSLTLGACGDFDRRSVDADGSCSSQFRADYNAVNAEARAKDHVLASGASASTKMDAWIELNKACTTFYRHHSFVTCKASSETESEKAITISSQRWQSTCDEAKRVVAAVNGEDAATLPPRPPSDTIGPISPPPKPQKPVPTVYSPIGELEPEDLQIKVASAEKFKRAILAYGLKMVRGKIGTAQEFKVSIDLGTPYCEALMSSQIREKVMRTLVDGDEFKVVVAFDSEPKTPAEHQRATISATFPSQDSLFLWCSVKGARKVTLRDMQDAVWGILDVSLTR